MVMQFLALVARGVLWLLCKLLPVEWKITLQITAYAAKEFRRLRLRFLAAGVIGPIVALAILAVIAQIGGPIPMTQELVSGFRIMVGIQIVLGIFAVLEMAYNDSNLSELREV